MVILGRGVGEQVAHVLVVIQQSMVYPPSLYKVVWSRSSSLSCITPF